MDTVPFGGEAAWTHPPTSGTGRDGWCWGRGVAAPEVAVAPFCHLVAHLRAEAESLSGGLVLLFDRDEHAGHFGGAKRCSAAQDTSTDIGGVMVGCPGMDELVIGGRGVSGTAAGARVASHSGRSRSMANATNKASELIRDREGGPLSRLFEGPGQVSRPCSRSK